MVIRTSSDTIDTELLVDCGDMVWVGDITPSDESISSRLAPVWSSSAFPILLRFLRLPLLRWWTTDED